ncbi:hypothetical protein [Polyangium spumosum]|uniref:Uncharacterized protein n=1 Tax=Polyangium spumosum TaxID=889282 RepID=A0A6N7PJR8_9BACT|nr:hypothetical protein [Polyangium spumosum]MRG92258.1 hypothetical protein [Polyangium spumosum]
MDNRKRTSIPASARRLLPLVALSLGLATTLPASAQPAPAAPPAPPPPPAATDATPPPPPPSTDALPLPPPPPPTTTTEEQPKPPKRKPKLSGETWGSDPMSPPLWAPADDKGLPVLPRRIDYEEGDILLPGYELKTRPSRSLLIGGIVTFAVPYGLSALVGGAFAFDDNDRDSETFGPLLVPVFGPFITLGVDNARTQEFPNPRSSDEDLFSFFMLLNGFTQMTGAAMIAAALLVPEKYLERAQALPGRPELLVGGSSAAVRLHF